MRTKGAKTNKDCWSVKITQGDIVLHDNKYKTLRDAGTELGLTYSQICELGPNGRNKKKSIRFKFMPKIVIKKIDEDKSDVNLSIQKIAPIDQDKEYVDAMEKKDDPDYVEGDE